MVWYKGEVMSEGGAFSPESGASWKRICGSLTILPNCPISSSMEWPGSIRTFRLAVASEGITLTRTPACNIVGAIVSRSIEFHIGLCSERCL